MLHFFSLKNPESEETKQSQRAVRLFRLLNLFCCYFFFFFDGPNTVYCISTQKHLLCLLESSFLLVFFFGVDYRIYHSDCISTVKLIVRFFRDMYIFYLKTYNKTCKLDYTLFVPHNQYMYFQGLSCTSKKQKAKKKIKKKWKKFQVFLVLTLIWL